MEDIQKPVVQNQIITSLLKTLIRVSLLISVVLSVVLIIFLLIQNRDLKKQLTLKNSQIGAQFQQNQENEELIEKTRQIDYFVQNTLYQYPILQEISTNSIVNIYSFDVKVREELENLSYWRLVETYDNGNQSFYLVSKQIQKKLVDVMVPNDGENSPCTTTKVITTGNEGGLNRELNDKYGYIIIAGEECHTRGGSDSISVYALSTGEKINITGNFNVAGSNITTSSGTATGKLMGVYGINNPQIVVSYGVGSKGTVQEIDHIAFFDLQTGKLIRVQSFK